MSKKHDVQQKLASFGFSTNDIQRAFEVYEKIYGTYPDYTANDLAEIIENLQNKDKANNNEGKISFDSKSLKEAYPKEGYPNIDEKSNDDDDIDASSQDEPDEIIINFTEKPFGFTVRSGFYDGTRKTTQISSIKEHNKHKWNGLEVGLYVLKIGDQNVSHQGVKRVTELITTINVPTEIKFSKYPPPFTIYDSKTQTEFEPFFSAKIDRFMKICIAVFISIPMIGGVLSPAASYVGGVEGIIGVIIICWIIMTFTCIYWWYSIATIDVGYELTNGHKTENVSVRITKCALCEDWLTSNWCTKHIESVELVRDEPFCVKTETYKFNGGHRSFGDIELNLRNYDNINMTRIDSGDKAKKVANEMENKLNQAIAQNTVYQWKNA